MSKELRNFGFCLLLTVVLLIGVALVMPDADVSAYTGSGGLQQTDTVTFTPYLDDNIAADSIDLSGTALVGVLIGSDWDTADLTFQGSVDDSTYTDIYDKYGTEYTLEAGASRYIAVPPQDLAGVRYLKIRSGTTAISVTQTTTTTLTLVFRPV